MKPWDVEGCSYDAWLETVVANLGAVCGVGAGNRGAHPDIRGQGWSGGKDSER